MSELIDENDEMTIEEAVEIVIKTFKGKAYMDLTPFEREQFKRLLNANMEYVH